jgi:hypothetical protein
MIIPNSELHVSKRTAYPKENKEINYEFPLAE